MIMIKSIKKFLILCFCLVVLGSQSLLAQGTVKGKMIKRGFWTNHQLEYVADELCVFVESGIEEKQLTLLFNKYQGTLSRAIDKRGFTLVVFPDSTDIIFVAKELQNNPFIKSIEPKSVCRISFSPNDTAFQNGKQWALYNYGQNPPSGTSDADIDMLKAWDLIKGRSADTVAVLDTGIPIENSNLSHDDLDDSNRFLLGADKSGETDNSIKDENGHGTHVLGIVGAETNNSEGIAGIVLNGKFLIVQTFNDEGYGSANTFKDAVEYAVENGAKVINYSGGELNDSSTMEDAVDHADDNGVIIVAATGNDGGTNRYPAAYSSSYDNVIAVSATDHDDQYATYANTDYNSTNIYAPGGYGGGWDSDDIYSTTPNYEVDEDLDTDYDYMAGTSMSHLMSLELPLLFYL